eukprot:357204-Chlamydomonas_euryale.AAC.11
MMLTKSVATSGSTVARPAVSGRTAAIAKPTLRSRSVVVRSADDDKKGEAPPLADRRRTCVDRNSARFRGATMCAAPRMRSCSKPAGIRAVENPPSAFVSHALPRVKHLGGK